MAVTLSEVTKLYVATFNRAPDAAGINYWANSGMPIENIAQSFFDQSETQTLYPSGVAYFTFVNNVYQNLFNREADTAGRNYWVNQLSIGNVSKQNFILAVINGAQNTSTSQDATILTNKQTVGLDFVAKGLDDITLARNIMANVDATQDSVNNALGLINIELAPYSLDLSSIDDTGLSSTDNITKNTSALTITGNALAGSMVKLYDTNGTTLLGTTTATSSGIFSADISLSAGTHSITAKATSTSGVTSTASSPLSVTVDTTTPTANLTSVTDDIGSVIGPLRSGSSTDDSSLVLAGTCEEGSLVNIYNGTALLGSAIISGTNWTYTVPISNGSTYQFNVKETDKAGNISAATSNFKIIGAISSIAVPHTLDLYTSDDTGSINNDNLTKSSSGLTITGYATTGTTIKLYDTDGITLLGTGTTNNSGTFSINIALSEGIHQVKAVASNSVGSTSLESLPLEITVDKTAPIAQITSVTDDAGNTTGLLSNGSSTDDASLVLAGTCEEGSLVNVYNSSSLLGAATVLGTNWTYTATIKNGYTYQFNVKETDKAGNIGSATNNFTVIGAVLDAPKSLNLTSSDDTGTSTSDNITKNTSALTITGTATAGSTVKLYDTNETTLLGTTTATSSGSFSIDIDLTEGSHSITAKASNSESVSIASSPLDIVVDTTSPVAHLVSVTDDVGNVTGALSSGATTDDASLVLAGTCESGSTVKIYNGTTLMGNASISGTNWTYNATIVNGTSYQLNAIETDKAGNSSASTGNFAITGAITGAPTSLDLLAADDTGKYSNDNITKNTSGLTISGYALAGSTVKLYDTNGTTLLGTATATSSGTFSTDISLSAGTHSITAKATSTSGVTSTASSPLSVTVDTTAPVAKLVSVTDNAGSVTGALSSGSTTDDTSLAMAGTCESGSSVQIYNGNTLMGNASISGTNWTYNATVVNGISYQFNVIETDKAGNNSAPTSNFGVTCNTGTTPTVTSGIQLISKNSSGVHGNYNSYDSSISADGKYVVFASNATNLVTGDTNSTGDIFRKDTTTGAITLASKSTTGVLANTSYGSAGDTSVSSDGRYIVFKSDASNLVTGDTNDLDDIFLKDMQTNEIKLLSQSLSGVVGNYDSSSAVISADGKFVAFQSPANNLIAGDTRLYNDIFLTNLTTGALSVVSQSTDGVLGSSHSYDPAISSDGKYIAFRSSVDNYSPAQIFLKNNQTGNYSTVSTSSMGVDGNDDSSDLSISSTGRYVVFASHASNLVNGDTNSKQDIFLKDTQTGTISIVSKSATGTLANNYSYAPSISTDGRYVVFESDASNLVTGDNNGKQDIFLKDMQTGTIKIVSKSATGEVGNDYSYAPSISSDGTYIVFESDATNLVAGDTNDMSDVFLVGVNSLF